MIVIWRADQSAADAYAQADPYVKEGVFQSVGVDLSPKNRAIANRNLPPFALNPNLGPPGAGNSGLLHGGAPASPPGSVNAIGTL
jgi:hypothetical protein